MRHFFGMVVRQFLMVCRANVFRTGFPIRESWLPWCGEERFLRRPVHAAAIE